MLFRKNHQIKRLFKMGGLIALFCLSVFLMTPDSQSAAIANPLVNLTPAEQQWLDAHPDLRIGLLETPPLVMRGEKGEGYQGLSMDYIRRVEKLLGVRFKLVNYPLWKRLLDETKSRNVDIIVTGAITLDRASYLDFTPPYIQLHNKIIVKKDIEFIRHRLSDLAGLKVAAVEGTAVYNFMEAKYPEIQLVPFPDEISVLEAVSFGETYAAVMEMARASYYIDQEKITNLTIAGDAEYIYSLCFSSRNDWSELNSILTKALASINEEDRKAISDKWLHGYEPGLLQSRTFWIAVFSGLGLIAVLLIIIWNIALRRKVARSTALIMSEVEQLARAESELRRLNRTLMVLGRSHEILMQFNEEVPLYNAICRHLVEVGGYMSASVASRDLDIVSMVAGYGFNNSVYTPYLSAHKDSSASETSTRAVTSGKIVIDRQSGINDDGSEVDVSSLSIPIRGKGGIIGALEILNAGKESFDEEEVALLTELTENLAYSVVAIRLKEEHREAEELVRKLSRAVEQSPVSIVITDCKGVIEYVNPAFFRITGYPSDEAVGRKMSILKSGYHNNEFYKNIWTAISSGCEWHGEFCNKGKNGKLYWESASISPIRNLDGEVTHYLGVKEDITNQKAAYEELQKAKMQAEDAANAKSSFLANMSHEIRTPMNAVIGMLYLVQQSSLTGTQKSYITKAEGAARSLLKIINDILDFSKIEAGRLQMESIQFTLSEVLAKVIDIATVQIGEKRVDLVVTVTPDTPEFLIGDPVRLGQVLLNLISNAVKFTEKGEVVVSIAVEAIAGLKCRMHFNIKDTGIGMTPEEKEHLFGAFTQADPSTTRRFGGTGLGLTISRQLVELMDGEIQVESEAGRGSTFSFSAWFKVEGELTRSLKSDLALLDGVSVLHLCAKNNCSESIAGMLDSFGIKVTSMNPSNCQHVSDMQYDLVMYDVSINDAAESDSFFSASQLQYLSVLPSILLINDRIFKHFEKLAFQVNSTVVKPAVPTRILTAIMDLLGLSEKTESDALAVVDVEGYFTGKKILLVEDNQINQEVIEGILERWGAAVEVASNGELAVQLLSSDETDFDAVLMDLQMPVMDGFEATKRIRENPRHAALPIIAMTASAMTSDRELCLSAGMNDHLTKPVDVRELFSVLHRWVIPYGTVPQLAESSSAEKEKILIWFPADTPELKLNMAVKRLGSRDMLLSVIRKFRLFHASDGRILISAIENGSRIVARRVAHTLKSLARTIGADEVGASAEAIELAIANGSEKEAVLLANDLSVKLDLLVKSLSFIDTLSEESRKNRDENVEGEIDPEIIATLLGTLSGELKKHNLEACNTFRKLKALLAAGVLDVYLKSMERAVDSLNFKEADDILVTIAEILGIKIEQGDADG